jgi:hypothetical protein
MPGENEEVGTFGETTSAFLARVEGLPVLVAIENLTAGLPAGVCPTFESDAVEVLGGSVLKITEHCQLWTEYAQPVFTAIMVVFWAFQGAMIILRA